MNEKTIQTKIFHSEDLPDDIRRVVAASPGRLSRNNGKLYFALGSMILCFPDSEDGNELAYILMRSHSTNISDLGKTAEIYSRILNDPLYSPDQIMLSKNGIQAVRRRSVVVFQSFSTLEQDLFSLFTTIVPAEKGDTAIPVDYQRVAFIKDLEHQSTDDLSEFTDAVIGTMEGEGIIGIKAGIGKEAGSISGLRNSYLEALEALDTGNRYDRHNHVYIYSEQALERIVDSIPEAKRKEIKQCFLCGDSSDVLSDEMLETVRVFFQNDLNLTAASRQLFIHRNTLNYRLDKIRKETGLDLRTFQDAVVFRIASGIPDEI